MKNNSIRIVIFTKNNNKYSETFIKAHIDKLPFQIIPRYNMYLNIEDGNGKKIWWWGRYFNAVASRLAPVTNEIVTSYLLSRHLKSLKANAVLAEFGTTGAYLHEPCKKSKIDLFVHFHGYDASVHSVITSNKKNYEKMFNYATGIVAVSSVMEKALVNMGADPSKIDVNRYGVNPDKFKDSNPSQTSPHFFAVGRFVEKKAPYLTILAFSRVVSVVPDAMLHIVGDGPLMGPCKRLIQALKLESSIILHGIKGPEEVAIFMRQSRAFLQHSLVAESGDSEGTPVAIIEAQMSGLPVIATRHAGIPDVVVDGETGFIVEEADVDGMTEAILKVAKDPELAGQLGKAARKRAIENFTMDRHISQLAKMITDGVNKIK